MGTSQGRRGGRTVNTVFTEVSANTQNLFSSFGTKSKVPGRKQLRMSAARGPWGARCGAEPALRHYRGGRPVPTQTTGRSSEDCAAEVQRICPVAGPSAAGRSGRDRSTIDVPSAPIYGPSKSLPLPIPRSTAVTAALRLVNPARIPDGCLRFQGERDPAQEPLLRVWCVQGPLPDLLRNAVFRRPGPGALCRVLGSLLSMQPRPAHSAGRAKLLRSRH